VVCNSTPLRMPFWTALPEGVCEKDEAWNMHGANNGGFRGFVPMNTHRREDR